MSKYIAYEAMKGVRHLLSQPTSSGTGIIPPRDAATVYPKGQLVVDATTGDVYRGDGTTAGGSKVPTTPLSNKWLIAGCLRKTGGAWEILSDANHAANGFDSVTADADKITLNTGSAYPVRALLVCPDETYAQLGVFAGASVSATQSFIYMRQEFTQGGYLSYSGSAWAFSTTSQDIVSAVWTTDKLRVTFTANKSVLPAAATSHVSVTGRGGVLVPQIGAGGIGGDYVDIEFYSWAGTKQTSESTDMKLTVIRHTSGKIAPSTMPDVSGANLWIMGFIGTP